MIRELNDQQILQFIDEGYVKLDDAFPAGLADEATRILWKDTNCDPNDPGTWTKPVIRLGDYRQEPFRKAANTQFLHSAFDQLAGKGNWIPRYSLGSFPIRFPSPEDPGDTGWHVDSSFPGDDPYDYMKWSINIKSKGRALLMLFLFSEVTEGDAPTRILPGSHLKVAKILEPKGDAGSSFMDLAGKLDFADGTLAVNATGRPGTVYLCHPFLVHAAQPHYGKNPRFMAQPPLAGREFDIYRMDTNYSPVELAIRKGIGINTDL